MDGEFLCEEKLGVAKRVAGGNFLIQAATQTAGLAAGERAISAIDAILESSTPFPGDWCAAAVKWARVTGD